MEEQRLRSRNRCVPFGVVRPRTPVATDCCYRFRTERAGFPPQNAHFALRMVGGEAGIRTLGPCGSTVFKSGLGRSQTVADGRFTRESADSRASNSPMFAPVATGCCYRLGVDPTSSLGSFAPRSRPRYGANGGIRIPDPLIRSRTTGVAPCCPVRQAQPIGQLAHPGPCDSHSAQGQRPAQGSRRCRAS